MAKLTIGSCDCQVVFRPRWEDCDEDSQQEWARVVIDSFAGKRVEPLSVEWFQAVFKFLLENGFPEVVLDKSLRKLCPWTVKSAELLEATCAAASSCGFRVEERKKDQANLGFDFWCVPAASSSLGSVAVNCEMEFLSAEEWNYFAPCLQSLEWREFLPAIGELELSLAIYANFGLMARSGPMSVFRHQKLWTIKRFVHHCKEGGPFCATPPFIHVVDKQSKLYGKLVWNEAFKTPKPEDSITVKSETVEDIQERIRCLRMIGRMSALIVSDEKGELLPKRSEQDTQIASGRLADFMKNYYGISFSEEMTHLFETSRNFEFDGQKQSFPDGRPRKMKNLFKYHSILKKYLTFTGQPQHETVELLPETRREVKRRGKELASSPLLKTLSARLTGASGVPPALSDASTAASLSELSSSASTTETRCDEMALILKHFEEGLSEINKKLAELKKKKKTKSDRPKAVNAPRKHSTHEHQDTEAWQQPPSWVDWQAQPVAMTWVQAGWPVATCWQPQPQPQPQPRKPGLQPPGSW
jgi:hypothetical protein